VHLPRDVVAVDLMSIDQCALQSQGFDRHVPDPVRIVGTDERFEFALSAGDAGDRLRAAATRGAPADEFGFEQDDAVAALGEVQGSGESGDPPANDDDVVFVYCG